MKQLKIFFYALAATLILNACSPPKGDFPGSEYMPDMAHSVAYEANYYIDYYYNTWDEASVYKLKELNIAREPVSGTVPRGYAGVYFSNSASQKDSVLQVLNGRTQLTAMSVPINGNVPFYYEDTEDERLRATEEIIENPFPITEAGLEKGEELYNIFCGICHGAAANGLGYLVADENPNVKYPAAPANLLLDDYALSSNGRYYFSIMYGKNVMGAYKDKLSYEERWQVIHWIRHLQAKDKGETYDATANTLMPEFGTPIADLNPEQLAVIQNTGLQLEGSEEEVEEEEGEQSSDDTHSEGTGTGRDR